MADKTIKTDETVHEELERLKGKHGAETFNDVLRLELGIDPGPDIEKLSAFLSEHQQTDVEKIISDIDESGDFERGYDREYSSDYLTFEIPDIGRKVVDIKFRDGLFVVRYRDNAGEMENCIRAEEGDDGKVLYSIYSDGYNDYDRENARDAVREKVQKSYRRWK